MRPVDFNQYGTRRGNHEVMMRGTFANIRIKNQMVRDETGNVVEGGFTIMQPSGERLPIYDAAMRYQAEKVPLVVFAGREYGTGSSRDWAAKGTKLLGVRAVIAQSFERIHRSNLVGMGVLPLVFEEGTSWQTLGLKGDETVTIHGLGESLKPRQTLHAEIVERRRRDDERAAHLPDRYAGRARIFPQRRDFVLRAAAARGLGARPVQAASGDQGLQRRQYGVQPVPCPFVLGLIYAEFEIADRARNLPALSWFAFEFRGQFLGLVALPRVEGGAEQGLLQPFVRYAELLRSLARGDNNLATISRANLVAVALPLPVEPRQVARAVILIEIELHAALIGIDGVVEELCLVLVLRIREQPLVAPAEQAEAFRRRPRSSQISSSSLAIASIGFPELARAKA